MRWSILLAAWLLPSLAQAGEATAAVAANFLEPLRRIADEFRAASGHELKLASGSTGKLYAQIREGAPFDLFLSADRQHAKLAADEGLAAGEPFTYAVGRLVLWSADPELLAGDGAATLRRGGFRKLAIASPKLAPYGEAAKQALAALGLTSALEAKLVLGESIAQTFQFVATGNAELGFVALSQLAAADRAAGSRWIVPAHLYEPIRQDAVLLRRGAGNPAAREAAAFLRGPAARRLIDSFGYGVGD
jgi:molybdate transport system substrate-binding protein